VELYDPASESWIAAESMRTARRAPLVVQLPTGTVLVTGGLNEAGKPLASAELFDPTTGKWTATAPMSTARSFSTAVLLPTSQVLVAGGTNGSRILQDAEVYNPRLKKWTVVSPLNSARKAHASLLLPSGRVLVIGGASDERQLESVEVYDPARRTWEVMANLIAPREGSVTVSLPTGQVLVLGGRDSRGPVDFAEVYDELGGSNALRPFVEPLKAQKPDSSFEVRGGGFRSANEGIVMVRLQTAPGAELKDLPVEALSAESLQVTLKEVPEGFHLLFVLVNGVAGGGVIQVDGTSPTTPVVKAPSRITNNPRPIVGGTAERHSSVHVLVDEKEVGSARANEGGGWELTLPTALEDGVYQITARASDEAGNTSSSSAARSLTVDTKAPEAPGLKQPGAWVTDSRVTLGGTGEFGSRVKVSVDGQEIDGIPVDTEGFWAFTLPMVLEDRKYTVILTATDEAGNVSLVSTMRTFTVDTQKPAAPEVLTPREGAELETLALVIEGTAEAGSTVRVLLDRSETDIVVVGDSGAWSFTPPTVLEAGEHEVSAIAIDAAGNASSASAPRHFTVKRAADPVLDAPEPVLDAPESPIDMKGGGLSCTAGSGESALGLLGLAMLGWLLSRRRRAQV
jgi:MYXO-CTERM domain-containing protein